MNQTNVDGTARLGRSDKGRNGRSAAAVILAGLLLSAGVAAGQQTAAPTATQPGAEPGTKKAVKTAADLPVHTYRIEESPSQLLESDAAYKALAASVRANLEADLATYDIKDRSTLQQYYGVLQSLAISEDRLEDAVAYIARIQELEKKESKKLMSGQVLRALVVSRAAPGDAQAKTDAFKAALKKSVGTLPWDVVREDVIAAKGRAEMLTRDLMLGQIKGQLDPVVAASKGELSGEIARGLVSARVMLDTMLPLQPAVAAVYAELIAANAQTLRDTWTPTLVTLSEKEAATPVVVCVWDSGMDVLPFAGKLWANPKETANGKDDDGNGYVDDINGIAFDLESKRVPQLLHPVDGLASPLALVESHMKGLGDVQANIQSKEADAFKAYVAGLKPENVNKFLEDLGLYGNYSHGTHVAGISAEGNPFARVLPVRLTFDYRSIPLLTPTEELGHATAKGYQDAVAYMKAAGVRVVNMSWGGTYEDIRNALERKNAGKSAEERATMARKLFAIGKAGLETAIKDAPGILFIAAAGNSDNDNAFTDSIPSGLNLPNLLTIGAVDSSGKPTGFTTFGGNVRLYANGFEVESYVPGGKRLKFSGTSMAAPNATNLAAKILARNPGLSPNEVIDLMTANATPMEGRTELRVIHPQATLAKVPVKSPAGKE